MSKIILIMSAMIVLFSGNADAEVSYQYLDAETLTLEAKIQTTKSWTADEKHKVDRYFQKLDNIAPDLVRLIKLGNASGPIYVIRVDKVKRSLGLAKQTGPGAKTYLVLSDMFFRAYDATDKSVGYDGGNFTLWFFVHEMVHLAEFRSLSDVTAPLPTKDPNSIVLRVFSTRILQVMTVLFQQKIDFGGYVLSTDASRVDIVRNAGLPTKYSLLSTQEALAETITAMILSPAYDPPSEIQQAVNAFYKP